jgi:methyl coenzyme M reductase gamma subunit
MCKNRGEEASASHVKEVIGPILDAHFGSEVRFVRRCVCTMLARSKPYNGIRIYFFPASGLS